MVHETPSRNDGKRPSHRFWLFIPSISVAFLWIEGVDNQLSRDPRTGSEKIEIYDWTNTFFKTRTISDQLVLEPTGPWIYAIK